MFSKRVTKTVLVFVLCLAMFTVMLPLTSMAKNASSSEYTCTCGEEAPDNLAYHADDCPRKQYFRTLFAGKNAAEIYAEWDNYDDKTHTDILNMLEAYYYTTYTEMIDLVKVEVTKIMDTFVESVEAMPEVEEVSVFDDAETSYAEMFAITDRDSIISPNETQIYEAAYVEYAKALGRSAEEISPSYPATDLEEQLRSEVTEALELLDDAEEKYALTGGEASAKSRSVQGSSVIDIDEKYAAAYEKVEAILEVKPNLLENEAATVAESDGHRITSTSENIEMYLFNYGPQINTQQTATNQGYMRFIHSEGQYGWAVDSVGDTPAQNSGGWATLYTTLNSSRTVPHIMNNLSSGTTDTGIIKAGPLAYLFDPTYTTGRIDYNTYKTYLSTLSTDPDGPNPYQYHSICFPVSNSDGSGTGLFQKEGSYYVYDSAKNAAWYNASTQKFEIYDYVLRPAYTTYGSAIQSGNFLPFNKGHEQGREDYQTETYEKSYVYDGQTRKTVVAKTETVSQKPEGTTKTAYRLWGNSRKTEVDLWFGLTFSFDFYQPKNGIKDNQPMVFEFLGDDDVFVYIDDILILDIGGTHGSQSGKINLQTGVVNNPPDYGQYGSAEKNVSTVYELMKATLGNSIDNSQFIDSDGDGNLDTFKDYTKHTLKFYYLERGGNISYCRLRFNMDPLPSGNLSIEKKLSNVNEEISDNQTYNFNVDAKDANNIPLKGMTYQLVTNGVAGSTDTVSDGETLSLRANQRAIFTNLKAGSTLKFREQANSQTTDVSWTVNGVSQSGNFAQATLNEDTGTAAVDFVCTNTRRTGSMTIEKILTGDEYSVDDEYSITVKFGGEAYAGTATKQDGTVVVFDNSGVVKLKAGDKITITKIPAGVSYTVTETLPTVSSEYTYENPIYENSSGNISESATSQVKITNTLKLLYGSLKVNKKGISPLDHNDKSTQTTLFHISGISYSGEAFSLEVTVTGNSYVIVEHLPQGNYTVTEQMDWSWRYSTKPIIQTAFVEGGKTAEVTFVNKREKEKWLSGDCYCENIWPSKKKEDNNSSSD